MHVKNTIKYSHLRTRNQLLAQGLVPTGAGEELWTNGHCGRTAVYYDPAETRPAASRS